MNLMQQMNLLIKKIKKIIKDIIDPTPGLFIDDQLKPNEQNYNSLMKLCLKKSLNNL